MPGKKILVFGGNSLLGCVTVTRMLTHGLDVTVANRGNWRWDTDWRVKPRVRAICCDRSTPLALCAPLQQCLKNTTFDAIVDFSTFDANAMRDAVSTFRDKAKMYIYISSDAIYDVCQPLGNGKPWEEDDAVRPESKEERDNLAKVEAFGEGKLAGEEVLMSQRRNDGEGIPYVIFRLPQVIGPRDNSYRLWIYQLWIKLCVHNEKPVLIPKPFLNYPVSLVYVDDVAKAIVDVIERAPEIEDTVMNLAYSETFTLPHLVEDIQRELGQASASWKVDESENANSFHPFLARSSIDSSRAKSVLSWRPTPWEDAIKTTVTFYEKALEDPMFEKDRQNVFTALAATRDPSVREFLGDLQEFYTELEGSL